jgi:hypothetical protein
MRRGAYARTAVRDACTGCGAYARTTVRDACTGCGACARTAVRDACTATTGRRNALITNSIRPRLSRLNTPQHFPGRNLLLLPLEDLAQDACARGRHLNGNLIRLDLDQGLVLGDCLPDILQPAQHLRSGAFGLFGRRSDFHRVSHVFQTLASC